MNKALYQFCQNKFKTQINGKLKLSSLLIRLHSEYGFGRVIDDYLYFDESDRQRLIACVAQENQLHIFRDTYGTTNSRCENAISQRNEKVNSFAVSQDFVLVNAINELRINGQQERTPKFTSLGVYIKAEEIISIEHSHLVLVENLAMMANLDVLNLPDNIHNALFLYRGDIKPAQQIGTAYKLFRRFQASHQLVCFSDLDPAGIQIAISSGANFWLAPENNNVVNLSLIGQEQEWFKQLDAIKWLQRQPHLPQCCQCAFVAMQQNRKTLKQEHILAHNIELKLYAL